MNKLLLTIVLVGLLVGCAPTPPPDATPYVKPYPASDHVIEVGQVTFDIAVYGDVTRFVDTEAGVVCYVGYSKMDCLPISETKLDE